MKNGITIFGDFNCKTADDDKPSIRFNDDESTISYPDYWLGRVDATVKTIVDSANLYKEQLGEYGDGLPDILDTIKTHKATIEALARYRDDLPDLLDTIKTHKATIEALAEYKDDLPDMLKHLEYLMYKKIAKDGYSQLQEDLSERKS